MSDSDTWPIITRSFVDRRSGVDTRSVEEQKLVGERRSGLDLSGLRGLYTFDDRLQMVDRLHDLKSFPFPIIT